MTTDDSVLAGIDAILVPAPPIRPLRGKLVRLDDVLWFVALDGCGHTIGPDSIAEVERETYEHANACPDARP
jgi:hypothetical protein